MEDVVVQFQTNSFEVAAGNENDVMRIALYAQHELIDLAEMEGSIDTKWFTIMGNPPMRKLFESALGLPPSIGQIDLDQQLGVFKERTQSVFGSDDPAQFSQEELREDIITRFILRDQLDRFNTSQSSEAIALTLLQG
jgi:hypothetical protein